jgi:hypothetical protein
MSRNGTPMQRLRDRQRASPAPERIAYLRDRGREVAVEAVEVVADAAVGGAAVADAKATAAQEGVTDLIPQVYVATEAGQAAQSTANNAQTTADAALGAGTVSGSAFDPVVDLLVVDAWVQGPQVNLTGVLAGVLTIPGSGPVQDEDAALLGERITGEFRVVEIDGVTETVLLTSTFGTAISGSQVLIIRNEPAAVADYSESLTTTGNLSYRIDARLLTGDGITSLALYAYARRAA